MEETLSLRDLFKTMYKRLGLITLLVSLSITIAAVLSFLVLTPVYETSTEILVNQNPVEPGQLVNQDIQTDLQLINTYSGIIKSPFILDQVVEKMNLNMTADELTKKITVDNLEESQIVTISVQNEDPAVAVDLANTTAAIFENDVKKLMNVDNVKILSPAILKGNPEAISPNPMLNMAIGAVIGLLLGAGTALLLEYLDTSLKDQQDIEEILGLPLLGCISPITEKAKPESRNIPALSRKGEGKWPERKRVYSKQHETL